MIHLMPEHWKRHHEDRQWLHKTSSSAVEVVGHAPQFHYEVGHRADKPEAGVLQEKANIRSGAHEYWWSRITVTPSCWIKTNWHLQIWEFLVLVYPKLKLHCWKRFQIGNYEEREWKGQIKILFDNLLLLKLPSQFFTITTKQRRICVGDIFILEYL